jgi:hypothetical protein
MFDVMGSPASTINTLDGLNKRAFAARWTDQQSNACSLVQSAQWRGSAATAFHNRSATVASIVPALTME